MSKYIHTTEKRRAYFDRASFIAVAQKQHNHVYKYDNAIYVDAHTKLEITCPKHGAFYQSPTNHVQGKGCPRCAAEAFGVRSRSSLAAFIEKATAVWGDMWDYSVTDFTGARAMLAIGCRKHGVFKQTQSNHLAGKVGCVKCNHMRSNEEDAIARYLSKFTKVIQRDRTIIAPKELDIYLPEHKLAIEYCGMYWHSHFDMEAERKDKHKHYQKYMACKTQGIRLITIYESEWQYRQQTLKRLLRNSIGKTKGRLMARKCELKKVALKEARVFYDIYHPQGGAGNGEHYGLYWKDKLVACMRFSLGNNDRGAAAATRSWTLSRYATRVSVAGAASRLFKAFLEERKPESVKSFSDNRYFEGGMYAQLGFVLDKETEPDYQVWSPKIGLRPKPHYQRRNLPQRLVEHGISTSFDPQTDPRTEAEITYLMQCGKIYDCGKKRWVYKQLDTLTYT